MFYKLSSYSTRVVVNSNIYLYNTFTDQVIALSTEIDELISKYKNNISKIKDLHPELFENLVQKGFFVEENLEEWKKVFLQWKAEDQAPEKFTMIIIPTLDCNMRCWYCYEQHNKTAYMSEKTLQSIKKLIERQTSNLELKGLNIDFLVESHCFATRNEYSQSLKRHMTSV